MPALADPIRDAWQSLPYHGHTACATCGERSYCAGVNTASRLCLGCFEFEHNCNAPNYRRRRRLAAVAIAAVFMVWLPFVVSANAGTPNARVYAAVERIATGPVQFVCGDLGTSYDGLGGLFTINADGTLSVRVLADDCAWANLLTYDRFRAKKLAGRLLYQRDAVAHALLLIAHESFHARDAWTLIRAGAKSDTGHQLYASLTDAEIECQAVAYVPTLARQLGTGASLARDLGKRAYTIHRELVAADPYYAGDC